MKNVLKFVALVAVLSVLAFGCIQDEAVQPTGPSSAVESASADGKETLGDPQLCHRGEACTPGYWKNFRMHWCAWDDAGYSPGDDFDRTFGTDYFDPNISLMAALRMGGGDGNGYGRLARHGTAALLNAASSDVNYPLDEDEVKEAVQNGWTSMLAGYNEDLPCPLGNCKH